MNKLLIVAGATSTGKTDLAIHLARKFNGEIISADSRQVYKGMDIGTGKDIPQTSKLQTDNKLKVGYRLKDNIPIWLVDVAHPDYSFNLADYVRLSQVVIKNIWQRGKMPIVVGGTGLYIKSHLVPLNLVAIPRNIKLRKKLEKLSLKELSEILKMINQNKWGKMNFSDNQNPRRLIRAIEISKSKKNYSSNFFPSDWFLIYLNPNKKDLYKRIDKRVDKRIKEGIVQEIENLNNLGYGFELPSMSTAPYKLFEPYFTSHKKNDLLKNIYEKWKFKEHALARNQFTWFNKMLNELPSEKIYKSQNTIKNIFPQIEEKVRKWYTNNNAKTDRNLT